MKYDTTALYVCIADFCKIYKENIKHKLIGKTKVRERVRKLDLSEQLFIVISYHLSSMRDFKNYYLYNVAVKHRELFTDIPVYARFVQIMPNMFLPLSILMHCMRGEKNGIYYADSTKLAVCNNARIRNNKTFLGLAKRGRTSMGWFYGFKLHMVINKGGEIIAVNITKGNVSDVSVLDEITKGLKGNIYADKGYISKDVFATLYTRGLKLIVGIKKNMKNYLMDIFDKINLRKRYKIENAFCRLKYTMFIEHTRHRSPVNFCINILAALCAYMFCIHKNVKNNLLNNAISYP